MWYWPLTSRLSLKGSWAFWKGLWQKLYILLRLEFHRHLLENILFGVQEHFFFNLSADPQSTEIEDDRGLPQQSIFFPPLLAVHFRTMFIFFLIQIYTESQTHQYLPNSCLFSSHLYYLTLLFLVSSVPRYRIKHLYQMLLQNHGGPQLSASRVHVLMAPSLIPSLSQYLF